MLAGQAQALTEPPLARLHDRLDLITRAPLTTSARLGAIASMRSEQASLVGESSYGPEVVPFVEVAASSSTRAIREGGLFVTFETPRAVAHMTATLSPRYDYEIALMNGNSVVATARSPKLTWDDTPDRPRRIEIDPSKTGTALRVRCGRGVGSCTLADVRVAP